ncbi:MAG: non-ribosomal peptide synthetase [Acidobacteriia bacterium]|nr:non-ribosomal peptide synthetase [Terriglobia bacterium]
MAESASPSLTATEVFEVPEDVVARLRKLCDAKDVPLSTALAVAAAALLHKYSCDGMLAVRTTAHANESWVGLLPVTMIVPDDPSFEQMLARAREVLPNRPEGPEIEILMPPEFEMKSQPLKLGFRKDSGGLIGMIDASLASTAEHLRTLLSGLTNDPRAPLSTVKMLGDPEMKKILIDWNQTDRGYPQGSVPELVEQQVRRTPHAVALIQGDQRRTYIELNEQANRLANYLRSRGVGPEVLVGLCMEQSLNAVVAILAILKAGGAYVPLDPSLPEHRLEEIASDSKLAIAVTSARFRHRVLAGIETVCVDRDSGQIAAENRTPPAAEITPDSAAYVLYTSASTGKPKGVVGIHRSITNGLMTVSYANREVCCLNTFLSYGFSLANLFLPLMSGVPVVVLSDEQIRDSNQMMTVLEKEGVTRLVLVPAVLQQILSPDFGASSRLRKITTLGVAGSRLTPSHVKRLAQAMPQARLYNRYASTEIGTAAAVWEVDAESLTAGGEIPIGRPVANTQIYILDRDMNPVPVGVAGEICVSAAHLARGYLNRPDLTQERFIPDPFSFEAGRRLYRTGDLGRFRSGGEIEFVGRIDHQVKINGFRVDLPEVEQALTSHIGVSEAVTAVREIGNRQRLVAYVAAKPVGTPSASQLRRYLQDRLADHMIPARFIFLKDLPKLTSGKIDRSALPLPAPVRPRLENDYRPPGSPMEVAIAQIWSDLLGLDPIGIHDPFRDLGGDSISAADVALRLGQRFGIDITPEEVLDRPTIAELAVYLSGPRGAATGA